MQIVQKLQETALQSVLQGTGCLGLGVLFLALLPRFCIPIQHVSLLYLLCSVEGEAPSSETGTSLDSPSAYHQGPLVPGSSLSPDHYEHTSVGAYGLYAGPGSQQRTRRPRLQHSTSVLRKQAEEEAIKRSRSLSESYELSSDLQDKQVGGRGPCPLSMVSQMI